MVHQESDLVFTLQCLQKRTARKRFRRIILDEWGGCAYCGRHKPSSVDHVIPRAKGGGTVKSNLVACCGECNLCKSDLDWGEWFRQQDFWCPDREVKILEWLHQAEDVKALEKEQPWVIPLLTAA